MPSTNQYGGMCGSGTNHYLAKVWTDILEAVDQENSACALVSIDFVKAFNSMCHNECLAAAQRLGATPHTVEMIRAFLTDRQMQFKVDSTLSTKWQLKGGTPQGTLLGNYLFVLTTNDLEKENNRQGPSCVVSDDLIMPVRSPSTGGGSLDSSEITDDDDQTKITGCSTPLRAPRRRPGVCHGEESEPPIDRLETTGSTASSRTTEEHTGYSGECEGSESGGDFFSYFSEYRIPHNRINDTPDEISFLTLDGSGMEKEQPARNNWKKRTWSH